MKKFVLFYCGVFFSTNIFCNNISQEGKVIITANIYKPITLEKVQDVDFGVIPVGATNVKAAKPGKLKVTSEQDMEELKFTWKDDLGKTYVSIDKPIKVILMPEENLKNNTKLESEITSSLSKGEKALNFNGTISKVPKGALGKYRGTFTVRAEYKN